MWHYDPQANLRMDVKLWLEFLAGISSDLRARFLKEKLKLEKQRQTGKETKIGGQ
jgi:hypothetical protein